MTVLVRAARSPLAGALAFAALLVLVGGLLLRGAGAAGHGDPSASVDNGAPRGLLAARLFLQQRGVVVDVARELVPLADDARDARSLLVLVPPPEQSALSPAEVDDLLSLVARGARLVVLCDGNEKRAARLKPLLARLDVGCDVDDDAPLSATATSLAPGVPASVVLHDRARLALRDAPGVVPLAAVGEAPVVVVTRRGRGDVVVFASASSLANDGLADGDGAALLAWLANGRRVLVDERHHTGRGRALARRAIVAGPGPVAAVIAAALLVLGSLLSLAPRRGDAPTDDDGPPLPSTATRVRGLAALLARARRNVGSAPQPTTTTTTTTTMTPPVPAARGRR